MQGSTLEVKVLAGKNVKIKDFVFTKEEFDAPRVAMNFARKYRTSCKVLHKISEKVCLADALYCIVPLPELCERCRHNHCVLRRCGRSQSGLCKPSAISASTTAYGQRSALQ
jgi:hypothetical protein